MENGTFLLFRKEEDISLIFLEIMGWVWERGGKFDIDYSNRPILWQKNSCNNFGVLFFSKDKKFTSS